MRLGKNEPPDLELDSLAASHHDDKKLFHTQSRESLGDHDGYSHEPNQIPTAILSRPQSSTTPLGIPTQKRRIHSLHLFAAAIALLCMVVAIAAVSDENLSWHLGQKNYQLIVLGFLLGIMNLCLASVAPTFYLLIEAEYGLSTLQNYNGLLRNQVFSTRLNILWRVVITLSTALPLGLSVAYKTFVGGESAMSVHAPTYTQSDSVYGMFAPPGLQLLGEKTGVSVFSNATLPFAVASSPDGTSTEPPLPTKNQAYGFNVLFLDNDSAAILDIPQPAYLSSIQALLAQGESWNISAAVFGTVATFNNSKVDDPDGFESYFTDFCEEAKESSGAFTHQSLMNDWSIVLLNHASPGDQSMQYIGLTPDPGITQDPDCSDFYPDARLYNIKRQQCFGIWSITRGGIQLVEGSCYGPILPPDKQEVIVHNSLFLGVWYMSSLVKLIGPFATTWNNSVWTGPSMAISLAAMVWSRITVLNSPISQNEIDFKAPKELERLSPEDAGLIYNVDDDAIYIRPTLRKSGALYFILILQPFLLILMLILSATLFYTTPTDREFGLISIMSGIDRDSLDNLAGAGLSGKLLKSVKLYMRPAHKDQRSAIEYHLASTTAPGSARRLAPKVMYH